MRSRSIMAAVFMVAATASYAQAPTYLVTLGANFFSYETIALETALGAVFPLDEGLSIEARAAYAIHPEATEAFMAIPLQAGVRFSFQAQPFGFHCSVGVSPVITVNPGSFRIGPYLAAEGTVRVHRFMELALFAEQDLLFGGPTYVATGTRLGAGLRFSFDA